MELRPIQPDEFDAVRALRQRAFDHDGVPEVLTLDEVVEEFTGENVVLETDTRVAEIDGRLVAATWTFHLPSEIKEERCYLTGGVDPEYRRRGIGTALLSWGIERATAQLNSSTNDLPKFVRVDNFDFVEDAHRLYTKLGFEAVRYNDELLRPLTDLPDQREVDGVSIVALPADRDEEVRIAKNAAFADHWGSTPTSPALWSQVIRGATARPDWSCIALDSENNVIGHCANERYEADDERLGRKDGWIGNVGTLAEWRGQGIASAMIIRSLHAFADAGLTHASIGVDSANPTGAAELYRNLGFQPHQRSITHQIEL